MGHARKERVLLIGTDQRITSGPAAKAAASHGANPPSENRSDTWLHPNASQRSQIFPLHRGRRPYMTHRFRRAAPCCSITACSKDRNSSPSLPRPTAEKRVLSTKACLASPSYPMTSSQWYWPLTGYSYAFKR